MKAEYDFSKGERGKFFNPETELSLPVYLEADVGEMISHLAEESGVEVQTLVNDWLRANLKLLESLKPAV